MNKKKAFGHIYSKQVDENVRENDLAPVYRDRVIYKDRVIEKIIGDTSSAGKLEALKKQLEESKIKSNLEKNRFDLREEETTRMIRELETELKQKNQLNAVDQSEIENKLKIYEGKLNEALQKVTQKEEEKQQIQNKYQILNNEHKTLINKQQLAIQESNSQFEIQIQKIKYESEMKLQNEIDKISENQRFNISDQINFQRQNTLQMEKLKMELNTEFLNKSREMKQKHQEEIAKLRYEFQMTIESSGNTNNYELDSLKNELLTVTAKLTEQQAAMLMITQSKKSLENQVEVLKAQAMVTQKIRVSTMDTEANPDPALTDLIVQYKILSEENQNLSTEIIRLKGEISSNKIKTSTNQVDMQIRENKIQALNSQLDLLSNKLVENENALANNLGDSNINYQKDNAELQGKIFALSAKLSEIQTSYNLEFRKSQGLQITLESMKGSYDDLVRSLITSNETIVKNLQEEIGKLTVSVIQSDTSATQRIIELANQLADIQSKNVIMVARNKQLTENALIVNQGHADIKKNLLENLEKAEEEKGMLILENNKNKIDLEVKEIEIQKLKAQTFTWQSSTSELLKHLERYQSEAKSTLQSLINDFNQASQISNQYIMKIKQNLLSDKDRQLLQQLVEKENFRENSILERINPVFEKNQTFSLPINTEGVMEEEILEQNSTTIENTLGTCNDIIRIEVLDQQRIVNDLNNLVVKAEINEVKQSQINTTFYNQLQNFYLKFRSIALNSLGNKGTINREIASIKKLVKIWSDQATYVLNQLRIVDDKDLLNVFTSKYYDNDASIPNRSNSFFLYALGDSMVVSTLLLYWNTISSIQFLLETIKTIGEKANRKEKYFSKILSELAKEHEQIKVGLLHFENDPEIKFLLTSDIYNRYNGIQNDYNRLSNKKGALFGVLNKMVELKSEIVKVMPGSSEMNINFRDFTLPINFLYPCISPFWSGAKENIPSPFITCFYSSMGYEIRGDPLSGYTGKLKGTQNEHISEKTILSDYTNTSYCDLFLKSAIALLQIAKKDNQEEFKFRISKESRYVLDKIWFSTSANGKLRDLGAYAISAENMYWFPNIAEDLAYWTEKDNIIRFDDIIFYFADLFYQTHLFLKNMGYQNAFSPILGEGVAGIRDSFNESLEKFLLSIYNKTVNGNSIIDFKIRFWNSITRFKVFDDTELPQDKKMHIPPNIKNQMVGIVLKYLGSHRNIDKKINLENIVGNTKNASFHTTLILTGITQYCTIEYAAKKITTFDSYIEMKDITVLEDFKAYYNRGNSFYNFATLDSDPFIGIKDSRFFNFMSLDGFSVFMGIFLHQLDQGSDFFWNDFFTASTSKIKEKIISIEIKADLEQVKIPTIDSTENRSTIIDLATPRSIGNSEPIQLLVSDSILKAKIHKLGETLLNLINNHEINNGKEELITPGINEILNNPMPLQEIDPNK